MAKNVILGLDQQFSSTNKDFLVHRHLQKKFCSFFFLRPKFSFGMLFRQFGNFPMSSCGPTVLTDKIVTISNTTSDFRLLKESQIITMVSVNMFLCFFFPNTILVKSNAILLMSKLSTNC